MLSNRKNADFTALSIPSSFSFQVADTISGQKRDIFYRLANVETILFILYDKINRASSRMSVTIILTTKIAEKPHENKFNRILNLY